MSIKILARELYRAQQAVDKLEKALADSSVDQRARIEAKLRKARSEKEYLQRALDGQIGR